MFIEKGRLEYTADHNHVELPMYMKYCLRFVHIKFGLNDITFLFYFFHFLYFVIAVFEFNHINKTQNK